jgi:hypothetical protein
MVGVNLGLPQAVLGTQSISRPGGQAAVINRCWFLECKSDNVSDTWMSSRGQKLQSAMGVRLGLGGKSASLT